MTNDENVKSLEEQIDYKDAIIGIPFSEYMLMEETILKAKNLVETAVLAANPEKKQKAIEEASEVLKGMFFDG